MEELFRTDVVLEKDEICNYEEETKELLQLINSNRRVVIYGYRNIGKTSFIKSLIIPKFQKHNPRAFVFFADLLGVKTQEELTNRIKISFEQSYASSYPVKSVFNSMLSMLKNLRPAISYDPQTSAPSLGVSLASNANMDIASLFKEIKNIATKVPVLIVLDEFQDISFVPEAEAVLRDIFQNYPATIPIVCMGSKKHLLAKIFAKPSAPFYSWGMNFQLKPIEYEKYTKYIRERFNKYNLVIENDTSNFIQNHVRRIPEAINTICQQILDDYGSDTKKITITEKEVVLSLKKLLGYKQGRYEEYMANFTSNMKKVIIQIAKAEPVKTPHSVEFISSTGVTSAGIKKILTNLEDSAIIYKTEVGYFLADPILKYYLREYR